MPITLEEKLKALREVDRIYALAKTWHRLVPNEKRPNFEAAARAVMKRALGEPIESKREPLHIRDGAMMHEHSPRTARVIERTLRNGVIHPDVLHSYRNDKVRPGREFPFYDKPAPRADTPDVIHYVQHGSSDLSYPHGHMQGYGFVPSEHHVASHVQLEGSVRPETDVVPTKGSVAGAGAYH